MYYTRGLLPHILHSRFSSAAPFSPNNSPLLDSLFFPFSISVSHLDSQGVEISSRSEHIDLQKGDDDDGDVNSNASRLGKKFSSSPWSQAHSGSSFGKVQGGSTKNARCTCHILMMTALHFCCHFPRTQCTHLAIRRSGCFLLDMALQWSSSRHLCQSHDGP